jgi:deoxyxylulose-5-phosphate synthase
MSKLSDQQHQAYTNWIINQVGTINPYTTNDNRMGYIYAAGFLASYLASLMQEDPYTYKRFKAHIESKTKR